MQKSYLLFFVLSIVSGCAKKTAPLVEPTVAQDAYIPVLRQFNAQIDGVECSICAQDVVQIIKTIDGVHSADYALKGTEYEGGHVRFYYDVHSKNLDLRLLDSLLLKQGFELSSLRGAFYLEPFSADGQKFVALSDEIAMPFSYTNVEVLKQMIANSPERLFAQGLIKKDPQENAYSFTLIGPA